MLRESSLPDLICPICGKDRAYLNYYSTHWGYCDKCNVRWLVGVNMFDSWRHETEEEFRENAEHLIKLKEVK